jgi:hypothetical protein
LTNNREEGGWWVGEDLEGGHGHFFFAGINKDSDYDRLKKTTNVLSELPVNWPRFKPGTTRIL